MKLLRLLPFVALLVPTVRAIEPWADKTLPVKAGLALWLDANAETRVLAPQGIKLGNEGMTLDVWHDGSGHKRDARQASPETQPRWQIAYPSKVFAFDGKARHWVVETKGWTMSEATILVLARARSNAGGFRTLVSAGKMDAGGSMADLLTLDLGGKATDDVRVLHVAGPGFQRAEDPLSEPVAFGAKFSAVTRLGADQVTSYLGLRPQSRRPRAADAAIHAERFIIGASNDDNANQALTPRGFFHGDIFEILVYDRALTDDELFQVNRYFEAKYAGVVHVAEDKAAKIEGSVPLLAVKDPPVIQPLVPGFTVRKLPFQLTNINFLRYRPDGRLYAGAYDGKIHLLRDTDGDGVEDKADVFYESKDLTVVMGMALTPPGYPRGEGVFVVSRGRALLILDPQGEGKGTEVVTVAEGWPPPQAAAGGVSDSLGIALAPDGSVYFGLGTDNFTNAYLLNSGTGQAGYRLGSERGTIQRVTPDFSRRETVATGIRFTVGLAFNAAGDLFATEQEGATWIANGNPFDELLHIQTGRHYGFPPAHPRHLPNVIDEPSTFDYTPQHQSTVGLAFDEPAAAGAPIFGAPWWQGDALVAAMSRGKIYRTKLVKTVAGYVAKNDTIMQLQRIIIDQAISPRGGLTVTLHGGKPDWGTGPTGAGELWQIVPHRTLPPQPVLAWSANPTELRVTFDAPLPAEIVATIEGKVCVAQGRYAQAGDRFEAMRPGYQVVKNQLAAPRFNVAVRKLALADGGRTLVITTSERTAAATYAISIETDAFKVGDGSSYSGQIDVQADLTGLEAEWQPPEGAAVKTWLPHADFAVSRALTTPGAAQEEFFARVAAPGTVALRGQLDLGLMLYAHVQAGSKIDWEYPPETVTVTLAAARPFRSVVGDTHLSSELKDDRHVAQHTVTSRNGAWLPFSLVMAPGSGDPAITATWTTDRSAISRPFPLRRFLLPYARPQEQPAMPPNEDLPQLAGGDWLQGRTIFRAMCALCHPIHGEGARVGPDLSNLIFRDYDSVLRDIRDPNAAINPEHVAYTITKKDGSEITAVLLSESADRVSLAQIGGQALEVPRAEISGLKPLSTSLMPPGLDAALGAEKLRDLMRFLLVPALEPAPVTLPNPPAPRARAEFIAALQAIPAPAETAPLRRLRVVLCAAEKDAGHLRPGLHDYPLWRQRWSKLLAFAPGVTVETADRWPSPEQWQRADVVVSFHNNPAWNATKGADLDAFLARGGGLVFLHLSIAAAIDREALAQRLGHAWGGSSKYRIGSTPLRFKTHEITAGFPLDRPVSFTDETYAQMVGALEGWTVLATSEEAGGPAPQVWLRERGAGRIFVCVPGHHTWTHDDPLYRLLVFRGLLWSAREPLGRFNALTTLGATLEP